MKSGIHPEYRIITATCACGETFVTRSTREELRLEICSKCHPFFTGKQKLIDSAGRVERFHKRYGAKAAGGKGKAAGAAESDPAGAGTVVPKPAGAGRG